MSEGAGVKPVSRHWRTACICFAGLVIAVAAAALYVVIDQGVTITYMQDEGRHIDDDFAALRALIPAISKDISQRDLLVLLRRGNPKDVIFEEGKVIRIGQLEFHFDEKDTLTEVRRQ